MDNRVEVREFLTSRRAKITPQQAGMPDIGARRVPGLRRGEVAALAGVSVEYYAKLERGAIGGVSASVLDAIARALQLDDAERTHLFNLAHAADGTIAGMRPRRRSSRQWTPRPSLTWVLDKIHAPAIVRNGRMDLLATNDLGRAMHAALYDSRRRRPAQLRPFHLPRPGRRPRVLPALGGRRGHLRRHPPDRGRPRSTRQGPPRPRRRAVHPQQRVPAQLGKPRRPPPRCRQQAVPPCGRR